MLLRICMRWDDGCILCEWHCIIFSMEAFPLWRPTVGQQFSLQHHCCILAAVCFCFYFSSHSIHGIMYSKTTPQCHLIPFHLYHIVLKSHTHSRNFQRMLFSYFYFICFEGASSHTLGNRNHFTFFSRSFSLFFLFILSFLLLYFIILTELLSASIKLPIFL